MCVCYLIEIYYSKHLEIFAVSFLFYLLQLQGNPSLSRKIHLEVSSEAAERFIISNKLQGTTTTAFTRYIFHMII